MGEAGLVGRDAEIASLAGLADRTVSGHGRVAVLEGEPGIGKTAVLEAATALFERRGLRVLRGAADELDQRVPFASISTCWAGLNGSGVPGGLNGSGGSGASGGLGGLDDADEGIGKIGRLLRGADGFEPSGAQYTEYAVIECVLALVDRWCAAGPLAIVLDDVQWADPATLVVLNRLIRVAEQLPLLIVLAHRAVSQGPHLTLLQRAGQAAHADVMRLGPLPEQGVAALVGQLVDARPDAGLLEVVGTAGGNPLYVTALVTSLSRDRQIVVDAGGASVTPDTPLPPSLTATIMRQLDFVSPKTRKALHVAALIGTSFDVSELATLMATPPLGLLEAVREAIDVGLVRDEAARLTFRHELIRRALYDELAPSMRAVLHLQAGQLLAAAGAPVERAAGHFAEAGIIDANVVEWLLAHADGLRARAPMLAVDLLRGAVSQLGTAGAHSRALSVSLAEALLWAGLPEEASGQARMLLALVDDDLPAQCVLHWVLAQSHFRLGRLEQAADLSREALPIAESDVVWLARFHGFLAQCLLLLGDTDEAEEVAVMVICEDDYQRGTAHARLVLSIIRLNEGHGEEALELADRVVEDMDTGGARPDNQMGPFLARGRALIQLDRFAEAVDVLEAGRRSEEEHGGVFLGLHYQHKGLARFWQGRWDDALAELRAGLDVGDVLGLTETSSAMIDLIAFHRGSPLLALQGPSGPGIASGGHLDMMRAWVEALAAERSGDCHGALESLTRLVRHLENGMASYDRMWLYPDLARLCVRQQEADSLSWVLADLRTRRPTRSVQATTALCSGLAQDDLAALTSAAELFHAAGIPLFEGYAREQAAALCARRGEPGEARVQLQAARSLFAGLQATWDVARAEARMREFGVRPGAAGRRQRPKTGWGALTGAENKVAALVSLGYSNPDIAAQLYLSRRTVQAHLSSIFAKLGLSTRVELAVLAARREQQPHL